MTQNPFDSEVENILVHIWYPWSRWQGFQQLRPKGSAMFRDVPASRGAIWDDMDARDVRLNRIKAERADWCVNRLPTMQAIAVDLHCANKNGASVLRSGRLSWEQATDLYAEALVNLIPDMIAKELITREAA